MIEAKRTLNDIQDSLQSNPLDNSNIIEEKNDLKNLRRPYWVEETLVRQKTKIN